MSITESFLVNPFPDKYPGLEIGFIACDTADDNRPAIAIRMKGDSYGIKLTPEAALALASLIQLKVKSNEDYFSLAS